MSGAPPPPDAEPVPRAAPPRPASGLAASTLYTIAGHTAPLAVAYFAIPVLAGGLGASRFGLLTLAWAVLGYFSLFDLGLGRALTHAVAHRLASGRADEVPSLVWTGLAVMSALGILGGAAAGALAPWLVGSAIDVPPPLQREALRGFLVLAVAIPVVIISAAVRGVLEAAQRFDLVNAVRVPLGVFSFVGPVLVMPLTHDLGAVTAVLLLGRVIATAAWAACVLHVLPALRRERRVRLAAAAPLLRVGSWMTVSNVVGPLMVTLDRFVIAGVAGVSLVAYYTAPWEAVTKLWLVPGALGAVLFPAFATVAAGDRERARTLYLRGLKSTALALLPAVVVIVGFAREGLGAWLGAEYAAQSTVALRWLAAGVLVNSVAQIPFTLIQANGRPDVTAKLHLLELPAYLVGLVWLVSTHGIVGAAVAWTARVAVDAAALFAFAQRLVPLTWPAIRGVVVLAATGAAAAAVLAMPGHGLAVRCAIAAAALGACVATAWFVALSAAERARVRALPSSRFARRAVAAPPIDS